MKEHKFLIYKAELPVYEAAFLEIQEQWPDCGTDGFELKEILHKEGRVFFSIRYASSQDLFNMGMLVERYRKEKQLKKKV